MLLSGDALDQQIEGVLAVARGHWHRAADYAERRRKKALSFERYLESYIDQVRKDRNSCLAQRLAGPGLDYLLRVTPVPKRNLLEGAYQAERRRLA